jgi:hypothetical protein
MRRVVGEAKDAIQVAARRSYDDAMRREDTVTAEQRDINKYRAVS